LDILSIPTPALTAIGAAGAGMITFGAVMGIRKLIQIGQFSYHNSRLSTVGNPYVTRDEVLPLVELASPEALTKSIASDLLSVGTPETFREVDGILMRNYHGIISSMASESPDSVKPFISSYLSMVEGEELKRLMRLIGIRKEPLFPVGRITEDVERQMLSSKDLQAGLEVMEGLPVSSRIAESLRTVGKDDLPSLDEAIDRYKLDVMKDIGGAIRSVKKGSGAFFDILCDSFNVHLIMRSKKVGMERDGVMNSLYGGGGTMGRSALEQMVDSAGPKEAISLLSGSYMEPFLKEIDANDLTTVETALSRMLLEGVKGLSHSFGSTIGPTIRYLYSKEMELKNLRVLYQSAFSGWNAERTRKLLVIEEGSG
jgi:vacuolar-type H+-ATPase subunit C/Vma6